MDSSKWINIWWGGSTAKNPRGLCGKLTSKTLIYLSKEALKNEWLVIAIRDHWSKIPCHSYAKLSLPINSKQRAEQFLKLNKSNVRSLTGLLIGQANRNPHLFRIGRSNDKVCRLCREEDETAEHLLCECRALETRCYRFTYKGYFEPQELQKIPLHQIVSFINSS